MPMRDREMTAPPPTPPTSTFVRPAIGLLAGIGVSLLVIAIGTVIAGVFTLRGPDALTTAFPAGYVWGKLVAATVGAFAGGFTTSRITAGRSMYTSLVLALILFVAAGGPALRGIAAFPNDPTWFPLTLAAVELLAVLAGALLERRMDGAGAAR
jgi:hypothetical protein